MNKKTILHIDQNHALLWKELEAAGFKNEEAYKASKDEILSQINRVDGIVLRSRIPIDKTFLTQSKSLDFIARVGAGMENIDEDYALSQNIHLISAPEGNRNAVGEHTLTLLLALFNNFKATQKQIQQGLWLREENRGIELDTKTVGIIGYGNMGKAFAKKLRGFDCKVYCYDIKPNVGNAHAIQKPLGFLQQNVDILSLHTPLTDLTRYMINDSFIHQFKKSFWLLNTARGKCVDTTALLKALRSGKIRGAGLDVLEYEKQSFENLVEDNTPSTLKELLQLENVIITPHIAGWTYESKEKLAQTIADKIKKFYNLH